MKNKYIATGWLSQGLAAIFILVIISVMLCGLLPITKAYADVTYSDVLTDLKADASFDMSQWPEVSGDYSLQLITVAEGTEGDLFIYVYQPMGAKKTYYSTYVRLSDTIDDEIAPKDYHLTYLNSDGVFYKYKVDGYQVKQDSVRYYVVIQLMRPFVDGYDKQSDYDNTISAVPFAVNRQYKFSTINRNTSISALDIETIVITDKLVGHVVHEKEQFIRIKYTYMHFVAFRCDHAIEDLLEADVAWVTQAYHKNSLLGYSYSSPENNSVTLYAQNEHEIKYGFGNKQVAQWNEIQSVDDFIASNDINSIYSTALVNVHQAEKLTDQAKEDLRNMDWVLQFYQVDEETYRQTFGPAAGLQTDHDGVNVTDVTILRLKFVTNGVTYNLGVVDNKQTGSAKSSNEGKVVITPAEGSGWVWTILAIVLLVVLVIILWPAMPYIAKFIVWLIMLPIKAIRAIVKACNSDTARERRRERKERRQQRRAERKQSKVNAKKVKADLKSGKRRWADLSEEEEKALLEDRDFVDSMFDNDSWNGED